MPSVSTGGKGTELAGSDQRTVAAFQRECAQFMHQRPESSGQFHRQLLTYGATKFGFAWILAAASGIVQRG